MTEGNKICFALIRPCGATFPRGGRQENYDKRSAYQRW
uniref:Uncharacterized protein n=1 Tax=Ackermannviridae sp. TaxID=2831612 RepID=A0A8S5VPP6_9CAUD|nr:MAG TPA: hypothetical protein [Ackermannviridae sp.]